MKSLRECIADAEKNHTAIGHFNISTIDALWGIFRAAEKQKQPVIIGVSEGERSFIGVRQARALVASIREEYSYPIFLNADHSYSFDRVREAVDAGFDAVIFDGAGSSREENIAETKRCVAYAREKNPDIMIEGEIGYIGRSSQMLEAIPEGAAVREDDLTTPEEIERFVRETGVDLVAPAVGNLHGMLKHGGNPSLDIARISSLRSAAGVPLVLHGGSGTSDGDFRAAIDAGISIVHVNTELRVAYKKALALSLQENPDEVAPYKLLKSALRAVEKVTEERIALFSAGAQ